MPLLLLTLYALLLPRLSPNPAPKVPLKIDVENVKTRTGAVYVALFRAGSGFPEGTPTDGKKVDATASHVQATFQIEPGDYAVAVFHDENGNGQLDKRIFGIPKEPYGFSNNFRPKMSAPKFSDCRISIGDAGKTIRIALN